MKLSRAIGVLAAVLFVASCGSLFGRHRPSGIPRSQDSPAKHFVETYDLNRDGTLTRAELEKALRDQFAAADRNHDGKLDADEASAINAARWQADASTASPLIDWDQDGFIEFNEFATAARSEFQQLDQNGDGQITADEIGQRGNATPHGGGDNGGGRRRRGPGQ